ncbi:MAG TPA: acyltransferase [Candidatus Kapabacteria bacterium]|nr:acyltransferase [Candidatus Kapabacteria bacterium]
MIDSAPLAKNSANTRIRLDSIDALRGIAALMVAGYHIWGHYGVYPFPSLGVVPWTKSAGVFSYLVSPFRWGYLGVGLFLVLSGFCIHLPFARKRDEAGSYQFEWRKFYLRRLWRLYPAYAASVIGTFVLLFFAAHWTHFIGAVPSIGDLLTHLTLTHGYFDRYFYGIVDVYWSLALEFQLYLAYPIFLYLFRRVGLSRSIVFLTIFSLLWRLVSMNVFHSQLISVAWTGPYAMMGCIFARMPEWLFGAWLAEWFVRSRAASPALRDKNWKRLPLASAGVVVLFTAILSTLAQSLWVFTDSLFGVGFAFVIASAIVPGRKAFAINPPKSEENRFYRLLIWMGTISYSLYLFHKQFSWFANPWIREISSPTLQFALRIVVFLISIPIIALIFRLVEAPFLSAPRPGKKLFALYQRIGHALGIKSDAPIVVQLESVTS